MFKMYSAVLDKMGNWFGIIFKILLPLIVMYRPIKSFSFSIVTVGLYYGGNITSVNAFGIILFCLLYAVLAALLIWFPRAASVMEFLLIAYYVSFLGLLYLGGFYSSYISKLAIYIQIYSFELPCVLVFLLGKIMFYLFFIRVDRKQTVQTKRHDELLYGADSSGYLF